MDRAHEPQGGSGPGAGQRLLWCGDFLRAQRAIGLDDEAARAVLVMMGWTLADAAQAVPTTGGRGDAAIGDRPGPPGGGPARPTAMPVLHEPPSPLAPADADRPDPATTRVWSRLDLRRVGAPAAPAWLAAAQPLPFVPSAPRTPPPLIEPLRARSIFTRWLAQSVADGAPDVDRAVRELSRGRPLTRLPRRPRRTLGFGVELLIDQSPWLQPWRTDLDGLPALLRPLLPQDRLIVQRIHGAPPPLRPTTRLPGAVVLVAGDFGAAWEHEGPTPVAAEAWLAHARERRRRGQTLRALVPLSTAGVPRPVRQAMPMLAWSERTTLGQARQALRRPGANAAIRDGPDAAALADAGLHLAAVLAPAVRIDTALARRARRELLPHLDAAVERELFGGPWVESRGPRGIGLDAELVAALIEGLRDGRPRPLADVLAAHERWDVDEAPAVRLEAALNRLAAKAADTAPIAPLLQPLMKSLASGGDAAREASAWVAQASGRLPEAIRAAPPWQSVMLAAAAHLGNPAWLQLAGGNATKTYGWLLPEPGDGERWTVELHQVDEESLVARFALGGAAGAATHELYLPPAAMVARVSLVHPDLPLQWVRLFNGCELPLLGDEWLQLPGGDEIQLFFDYDPAGGVLHSVVLVSPYGLGIVVDEDLVLVPLRSPTEGAPDDGSGVAVTSAPTRPDDAPPGESVPLALSIGTLPRAAAEAVPDSSAAGSSAPPVVSVFRLTRGAMAPFDGRGAHTAFHEPAPIVISLGDDGIAHVREGSDADSPTERAVFRLRAARDDSWQLRLPDPRMPARKSGGPDSVAPAPRWADVETLVNAARRLRAEKWLCGIGGSGPGTRIAANVAKSLEASLGWRCSLIDESEGLAGPDRFDLVVWIGTKPPEDPVPRWLQHATLMWVPLTRDVDSLLQAWSPALRERAAAGLALLRSLRGWPEPSSVAIAEAIAAWSPPGAPAPPAPTAASPPVEPSRPGLGALWSALTRRGRTGLAREFERDVTPGLFAASLEADHLEPGPPRAAPVDGPMLVLVHGLFQRASTAFGPLWLPEAGSTRHALALTYGIAHLFEYRSISDGLVEAASALLLALPAGARLHLVGLSGGGVLGELLCAPADWRPDLVPERAQRVQEMLRLRDDKRIVVEHLVRVGAPVRGLALLERTGRGLGMLGRAVGIGLPFTPLPQLTDALTALLTDPASSPGLADLRRDSPLLTAMTRVQAHGGSALTVLAAEYEPDSVIKRAQRWANVWLQGSDRNDLLVGLDEVFGGFERSEGFDWFVDRGPQATHFAFFGHERGLQALTNALFAPRDRSALRHAVSAEQALSELRLGPPP